VVAVRWRRMVFIMRQQPRIREWNVQAVAGKVNLEPRLPNHR